MSQLWFTCADFFLFVGVVLDTTIPLGSFPRLMDSDGLRPDAQIFLIMATARPGFIISLRFVSAMFVYPANRIMLIARFLNVAMALAPLRFRIWHRSSS